VQNDDPGAWDDFVTRYRPAILSWCRHWLKVPESDVEDVTQEVLLKLFLAMKTFTYDPKRGRFSAWVHTVTRNTWYSFFRSPKGRLLGTGGSDNQKVLEAQEAPASFHEALDEPFEREL